MLLKIGVVLNLVKVGMYHLRMEYLKQKPRHKWEVLNYVAQGGVKIEECEERHDKIEEDVERIDKNVEKPKNNLNIMD